MTAQMGGVQSKVDSMLSTQRSKNESVKPAISLCFAVLTLLRMECWPILCKTLGSVAHHVYRCCKKCAPFLHGALQCPDVFPSASHERIDSSVHGDDNWWSLLSV